MNQKGVQPQVVDAMTASLANIVGLRMRGNMNTRGENLGITIDTPAEMTLELQQQIEGIRDGLARMSQPLPAEPVGNGASWTISQSLQTPQGKMHSVATHTITKLTKREVQIRTQTTIEGVPGPLQSDKLPEGATMTLDELSGTGSGTSTLVFSLPMPKRIDSKAETSSVATIRKDGKEATFNTHATVHITSRTK
ncbi:MAG: DUF6263 family protein [Polyangiales bacterium]